MSKRKKSKRRDTKEATTPAAKDAPDKAAPGRVVIGAAGPFGPPEGVLGPNEGGETAPEPFISDE